MRFTLLLVTSMCFMGISVSQAQDADKIGHVPAASSKFANLPGLPACTTISVQRGDPSKSGAVVLLKAKSGCVIPWHWHSANEQLIMVSGSAKVEMKDGSPVNFRPGDFIYMPSKHVHQFTCRASCLVFDLPDGAFDVHYVDAAGKEISADDALKSPASKTKAKMSKAAADKKEQ